MRYLGRAHLRRQAELAEAVRLANAGLDDWQTWHRDVQRLTGPGE
jgi:hypothetical protein